MLKIPFGAIFQEIYQLFNRNKLAVFLITPCQSMHRAKKCCTTAVLDIDSRKESVAYIIASLRELAPLVGQLSDYNPFIFILQLIEKQKENAFLIFIEGGFKLVKSSEFKSYKNKPDKRPIDFRHAFERHHINMKRLPNGKKDNHPSNLVNCYYFFHFIAHIIIANNEKGNSSNNSVLGLMSSRLLNVFGESKSLVPKLAVS
jgi:hypothetical protein